MVQYDGIIGYLNPEKRFGFVHHNGDPKTQSFFHFSNVTFGLGLLAVGVKVKFKLAPPHRLGQKPQAVDVRVVDEKVDAQTQAFVNGVVGKVSS